LKWNNIQQPTLEPVVATIAIGAKAGVLTKGTGAQSAMIFGLDANYNVTSETITLKGTTPSWSQYSYLRTRKERLATAGTGLTNAGAITFTTGNTVEGIIDAGANQTGNAFYTGPANTTSFIMGYYIGSSAASTVSLIIRQTPYIYLHREYRLLCSASSPMSYQVLPVPLMVPAGYDAYFNVDTAGAGVSFVAGFEVIQVKNSLGSIQ
jgi:hypothetical protein